MELTECRDGGGHLVESRRPTSSIRDWFLHVVLLVLPTLAICVALLEVGLRITGHLPSNTTEGIYEQHGGGYRHRKNITKVYKTPSFSCTIYTNSYGLRDQQAGPRVLGPKPYYAFVGDSLTFANGVDYQDSFVGRFGSLGTQRGIEAVNLGVGGHRFADAEQVLYDFLAEVAAKPAYVVMVFTPQLITDFERPHVSILVKDGYLFSKDSWRIPYLTVMLGNASASYCFFRDGVRHLQMRYFPSSPSAGLGYFEVYSQDSPWATGALPGRFEARLAQLDEKIRLSGSTPIYVYLPSSVDVKASQLLSSAGRNPDSYDLLRFYNLLQRHSEKTGIKLVNLIPVLDKLNVQGKRLTFAQDPHYDRDTNQIIGQSLYDAILGDRPTPSPQQ